MCSTKAHLKGIHVFAILEQKNVLIANQLITFTLLKNQSLKKKVPGIIPNWVTWIFSFADHSRETVLIWQDRIFTGERKYAQTKCKYSNITPKWSMHGRKQFGRSEIAFQLSIILLLVFPSNCKSNSFLVPQCTSPCILSGGRSWHFYLVAQKPNRHISIGLQFFSPLNYVPAMI